MKSVKEIIIQFENTETINIPSKYFGRFKLEDVETITERVAINSISKYQIAKTIYFLIYEEANIEYCSFDLPECKIKLFDRIVKYNDISNVTLIYEDDSNEKFFTDWEDMTSLNNTRNKNQISQLNDLGDLFICIGKNITTDVITDIGFISKDFHDMDKKMILGDN